MNKASFNAGKSKFEADARSDLLTTVTYDSRKATLDGREWRMAELQQVIATLELIVADTARSQSH